MRTRAEGRQEQFNDMLAKNINWVIGYILDNFPNVLHMELLRRGWKVERMRADGNALYDGMGGIVPSSKATKFMDSVAVRRKGL